MWHVYLPVTFLVPYKWLYLVISWFLCDYTFHKWGDLALIIIAGNGPQLKLVNIMVALRLPVIHGTSCNQLVTEIRHLAVSLNWDITKLYQTIGLLMKNNQVWQETTCVLYSTKDTIPAIHFRFYNIYAYQFPILDCILLNHPYPIHYPIR